MRAKLQMALYSPESFVARYAVADIKAAMFLATRDLSSLSAARNRMRPHPSSNIAPHVLRSFAQSDLSAASPKGFSHGPCLAIYCN